MALTSPKMGEKRLSITLFTSIKWIYTNAILFLNRLNNAKYN